MRVEISWVSLHAGCRELRGAGKSDQIIMKLGKSLEINHIPLPRQLFALHVLYRCSA